MENQTVLELHLEYRRKTEQGMNEYSRLMLAMPVHYIKDIEAQFWRDGMLAEVYGTVASLRDGVDYLQEWREGR